MNQNNILDDSIIVKEPVCNCGVVGIYNNPEASLLTFYALYALQHRGHDESGICTSEYIANDNSYNFNLHKGFGLVLNVFSSPNILKSKLRGEAAVGHNRSFSKSTDTDSINNVQPLRVNTYFGNLAMSYDGNFTNSKKLRKDLQRKGISFQTNSDCEIFLNLVSTSKCVTLIEKIKDACQQVVGAYSIVLLSDDKLFGIKDEHAVKPLCIGKIGSSYVFASESCALDTINAEYIREVKPGEIIEINKEVSQTGNLKSEFFGITDTTYHCVQEYIYFSKPESTVFGFLVDKVKRKLGRNLSREKPAPRANLEDKKVIVISVPDSSNPPALGYITEAIKTNQYVKLEQALIRNHYGNYINKAFTEKGLHVRLKYSAIHPIIKGRIVVLIEDSIVGGTTIKRLTRLIKECDPKEIHLRITSAPVTNICHYGMEFPQKKDLIINQFDGNLTKLKEYLEVDSIEFLSLEMLHDSLPKSENDGINIQYCDACLTGNYPIPINITDQSP